MGKAASIQVEISLKRVQTFIFEVPRLKTMLGANALIGEVMRNDLPELLAGSGFPCTWPTDVQLAAIDDPLDSADAPYKDDPVELFGKGILVRDGGRFIAAFKNDAAAQVFIAEVEKKLGEKLPGVLFDVKLGDADRRPADTETGLLDLPVLQVCQETGTGPASDHSFDGGGKLRWHARSVSDRIKAGDRFYTGQTRDVIGLLRDQLYPADRGGRPGDLGDLASHGYIALIHADGNGIGKRFKAFKDRDAGLADDVRDALGESFFYSMRVAVRRALVDALQCTFKPDPERTNRAYEVLMLGGDDLLLVCGADYAMHFAVNYAKQLENYKLADGYPLHVGIGVAIAKKTYPLHRLHELAEELASSAKRLYRSWPAPSVKPTSAGSSAPGVDSRPASTPEHGDTTAGAEPADSGVARRSVIDWQVVTQTWFDDVARSRQQSELIEYLVDGHHESLVLSGRPYPVTGDASLETLLTAVTRLHGTRQAHVNDGNGEYQPDETTPAVPVVGTGEAGTTQVAVSVTGAEIGAISSGEERASDRDGAPVAPEDDSSSDESANGSATLAENDEELASGGDNDEEKAARSPLRSLRGACERGRLSGEMAFARLPAHVRQALGGELWSAPEEPPEGTGNAASPAHYLTRALDIIDLREIPGLGRKQS